MTMTLQVSFRELVPLPSLEPEIRRRAAKLEQWGANIGRCHVTVESTANAHRTGHLYQVRVEVHVPPAQVLVAGTRHADTEIYAAVSEAFEAMDRQLEDHVRRQRGKVKFHAGDDAKPGDEPRDEPGNEPGDDQR
jgi:ribosomal subunit interface protein